jgi:8-oxo-dGTP pyrophosphatase MutT (NUDIX family)
MDNAARAYLRLGVENAPLWNEELDRQRTMALQIAELLETVPNCHGRDCLPAHMTGSAFVVDFEMRHAVLMLHRKIGRWMQPGGHADGDTVMHRVALKEAEEETGLTGLEFVSLLGDAGGQPTPFDVDVHEIPAWKGVPAHWHYDLRYVLRAPAGAVLQANHESNGLKWVAFADACLYTQEDSVLRMMRKLERYCQTT